MFRSLPNYRNLGMHNTGSEKKGQIYCCKGGFIDIAHLRKGADFANIYTKDFFTHIMNNKEQFTFKMKEPCTYFVKLDYSKNWQSLPEQNKKEIAEDVSIQMGEYASFLGTTWHELLTWYGYKMTMIIPEYHSALTIDDNFSNFLGSYIAARVLEKNPEIFNNPKNKLNKPLFNQKFSLALEAELEKLDALSPENTKKSCNLSNNKYRHLNIGLTGQITAYLLPGFNQCPGARPASYPVPNTDISNYGFSIKLEIKPGCGAGKKIRRIAGKGKEDLINPDKDFPIIMREIEKSAIKRGLTPVY